MTRTLNQALFNAERLRAELPILIQNRWGDKTMVGGIQ